MNITSLFLQRYDPLTNNYLAGYWEHVSPDLMRQRPHPKTNSIAWNLWHIARVEDSGLNNFVTEGSQVLDDGWLERMNVPWRHRGSGMTLQEVDVLDERIDLEALQGYARAVGERTRLILASLGEDDLGTAMDEPRLRQILEEEGLPPDQFEGFIKNYLGWTKGKCLFTFGLTHSWQHVGEMEVLASLLGVDFG